MLRPFRFLAAALPLGLVFSAGPLPVTTPAYGMSLAEAIRLAVETNPRVKAAQASRRATDSVLDQAQGRYLPEVNLGADIGRQRIDRPEGFGPFVNDQWRTRRQVTVGVKQILFDGFDRANDVYQSQARISAAAYKVLARSEAVALDVVEAYIDVVRHKNLVHSARENVRRHERLLKLVKDRFDGGQTSIGDLDQTRERLEAAKGLVSQIKISLETANAKFKSAVGVAPRRLKNVRQAKISFQTAAGATSFAISSNPRLQSLNSEVDVADFQKEQFRSTLYPELSLEGSATWGDDLEGTPKRSNELRGMVVLKWKLYDGGIRRARISELTEREYEKLAEYDTFARELREQIEIAWARTMEGRRRVASIRNQLDQNRKVVRAYRDEYQANKRSLLDVLDAENSRFVSEFDLSNASAIQRFSSYQLVAHTGQLLKRFGVATPKGGRNPEPAYKPRARNASSFNLTIPSLRQD
ncbi:MAG: TolC family outer membrane protein [Pseudomonadota bacterium]